MKLLDDNRPVFYVPNRPGIIDVAIDRNGVMVGGYSGETLEQIRNRYPGAELGKLGPVSEASDNMFRTTPAEITEERYNEMLEVLPPEDWKHDGNCESFKLCERTSGSITAIFCRIGARYFEFQDSFTMPHSAIVQRCKAA